MLVKQLLAPALIACCACILAASGHVACAGESDGSLSLQKGARRIPMLTIFGSSAGPKFKTRAVPEYPFAAKKRNQEGTVVLRLSIDEQGGLQDVEVVEATDTVFIDTAVASVKKSAFIPAKNNNRPVASQAVLPIHFTLKKQQ